MDHLQPVESLQPLGDLLEEAAHHGQFRLRVVDHPLRQRLPLDVFGDDVDGLALAGVRTRPENVRIIDAAGNPFFEQEAFERRRIGLHVGGWRLEHYPLATFAVAREIDVTAGAALDDADDLVAFELGARLEQRRARQVGQLAVDLVGPGVGQNVDAHELDGQIVDAAALQGDLGDGPGRRIEIGAAIDGTADAGSVDIFINTVGGEQQQVTNGELQRLVVDVQIAVHAQSAGQVALGRRHPDPVILGQLRQLAAAQTVDAGIADVEEVRRRRLDDDGAEGAHIAALAVVAVLAVLGLRMQPGIGRRQHMLAGFSDRPGVGSTVVVFEKTRHRRLRGLLTNRAARDAVGQRDGDAFGRKLRFPGHGDTVEILVEFLAPLVGILPDSDFQMTAHGSPCLCCGRPEIPAKIEESHRPAGAASFFKVNQ